MSNIKKHTTLKKKIHNIQNNKKSNKLLPKSFSTC